MGMTDPIADLLTRIRNASAVGHDKVHIPASNMKLRIVNLLHEEGFIRNFKVLRDEKQDVICVYLKYRDDSPVITHLERVSKPGRRMYVKTKNLPRVRNGLGIAIISTSRGVMTDHQARSLGLGGEHVCSVW
ncbi:30S ribosomal protein S8 [Myxococcota bacterium]|nr:30S ribosomal protein S8 [Myxococcota bacterium]MBU1430960.1 30S ribosomal protein S8 [Myxococcota bacterium]MBU1897245.1 30S ribosomal protein S8 [Myxococcota bacterium]